MKGIINLEAVVFLLAYFALTGILAGSLMKAENTIKEKTDFVSAKADAEECAMLADSVYSNSGGKTEIKKNCFFDEEKMKSTKGKETAEEKTLTKKITVSKNTAEIGVEEHYK